MIKNYKVRITTYHNDTKIATLYFKNKLIEEKELAKEPQQIEITWDNLPGIWRFHGLSLAFQYYRFNGYQTVSFNEYAPFFGGLKNKDYRKVKEKSGERLNVFLQFHYEEDKDLTLAELSKYHDSKMAMKYLVQIVQNTPLWALFER